MQWECSEREARNGCRMRHASRHAARASYARDKLEGAFLVSSRILVGCRTEVWRADGRSERQTDGEDQQVLHFFPKSNYVHWYLMIVGFDQKKNIFLVDSYGELDHRKDAEVLLSFFCLALLKKRAGTRHSSRRNTFMMQRNFDVLEWEYWQLQIPLQC
jgi:hypothetical protein